MSSITLLPPRSGRKEKVKPPEPDFDIFGPMRPVSAQPYPATGGFEPERHFVKGVGRCGVRIEQMNETFLGLLSMDPGRFVSRPFGMFPLAVSGTSSPTVREKLRERPGVDYLTSLTDIWTLLLLEPVPALESRDPVLVPNAIGTAFHIERSRGHLYEVRVRHVPHLGPGWCLSATKASDPLGFFERLRLKKADNEYTCDYIDGTRFAVHLV